MPKCKKCGEDNPINADYCQECGSKIKKFGEFTGHTIIDTIIWIVIVLLIGGIFGDYILGPIFSLI